MEGLEQRALLDGTPIISEFMAVNESTLRDRDGDYPDWLEIFNPNSEAVSLNGYWLTDQANDPTVWRFPDVTVGPSSYLTVFASGKDRDDPDSELHTNFKLESTGEYLALLAPDGATVVHEFSPQYPPQVSDVSYGVAPDIALTNLLDGGATATYLVPTDNSLQEPWPLLEFDDSGWKSGPTGLGYDTGEAELPPMVTSITALDPVGYWRFEETDGTLADNLGSAGDALDGTYKSTPTRTASGPGTGDPAFEFDDDNSATGFDGRREAVTTTASALSNLSEFTMMGIIRPEAIGSRIGLFGQNDAIEFGFLNATTIQIWTPGGGSLNVKYDFPLNEWHHVAVVGDGSTLTVYYDGAQVGQVGGTTQNYGASDDPFNIAGDGIFDSSGNYFNGTMDEVAIFDKALTADQIQTMIADPNQQPVPGAGEISDLVATNVQGDLAGGNSSLYVRVPFEVDDVSRIDQMTLRMSYDDGLVAYLNGAEVARRNAPGEVDVRLPFDAAATRTHSDRLSVGEEPIDLGRGIDSLRNGTNILAIHALNAGADNPDLLVLPRLDGAAVTVDASQSGYLVTPSPGKNNNPVTSGLGPIIVNSVHTPHEPAQDEPIVVTAEVSRTLQDVANVELVYRVMFEDEIVIPMVDDGTGDDAVADDMTYAAAIPGGIAQPGEMIRWYVRAMDIGDDMGRLPKFEIRTTNNQSPEYFGAMVNDPTQSSDITIFNWWVEDERSAGQDRGTRASIYYLGEFYDNLYVRARGGSTQGNRKTNFKFDFKGEQFLFDSQYARVEEFNLNSTASDKAYLRQPLAFDAYSAMGGASSLSFPIHVRRNDEFYGVFVFIEEPDDELLKREGLDPNGALYKVYNEFTSATNVRKKTRKDEGTEDLAAFIDSVRQLDGEELHNYLVDNVDLPATFNYLVATVLVHQNDNPHKNHYLYRDSAGTGEWTFLPWDNDLSWGSNWVGTSYSDVIYADVDVITFGPKPSHDLSLIQPSHPFVNSENHREWNNHWNRLMDAVLMDPVLQQMYLRRLRTGMDELMGAPGTTDSYFDRQFDNYVELMSADAAMDKEVWFNPWPFGTDQSFAEAVDVIKTEYLEVRREHLYVTHSVDSIVPPGEILTLLPEFAPGRFFAPVDNSLGTSWTEVGFDDSQWLAGNTAVGFEDDPDDYIDLIQTVLKPADAHPDSTSIYARVPFNVDNPSAVEDLTLRMKYDDGFVAYLNGTEVVRSDNLRSNGPQFFDSRSRAHATQSAQKFENFVISEHTDLLRTGENILAIHGMNSSATNSDLMILPELLDGNLSNIVIAGVPHEQVGNPALRFDPALFDANPESGNQDEEFVKIDNPFDVAVDISGWWLDGGIQHTFKPGTIIPAGSSLYVTPDSMAFRGRATGPSGGQGLFVQDGYNGHLSSRGETVQLFAKDATLMDTLEIQAAPSLPQEFLRVSEVNYNPSSLDEGEEFVELVNIGNAELDLTGVTLSQGPRDPFVIPAGTTIAAGEYKVIVSDSAAFQAAYPGVDAASIIGQYSGNLDNGGERIKLDDATGSTIVDFNFGDSDPWPERADGVGGTLVAIDPAQTPFDEFQKYYHWRGSTEAGGSPAAQAAGPLGVVVNEVLSNTDQPAVQTDAIEIHNTASVPVDVSGWYLSDSAADLLKFQIPAGTLLPAGGYATFDEGDFNFALDGNNGDDVWLVLPDGNGSVASFADEVHFGAAAAGESFGRSPNGSGRLTPMLTLTLGAENAAPRVGPLIISEINYNPDRPSLAALAIDPDLSSDDLEFVEIYNPTGTPLDLTDWRIRGGIDIFLDPLTTVGAGQTLVIVSFNPERPDNADRLAAFRVHYGIDDTVSILGGYGGQLSDSFERVQLQRPAPSLPDGSTPRLYEDEVLYDDRAPWPSEANGEGASLQRIAADLYGHDAASWAGSTPNPGTFGVSTLRGDFNDDGLVNEIDVNLLFGEIRSDTPDLSFDLTSDDMVDQLDRDEIILNILNTNYGDANLDRVFNSSDLVDVFQAGKYEDGTPLNALWQEGDWDADGDFTSSDIVLAFRGGAYVSGVLGADARDAHSLLNLIASSRQRLPEAGTDVGDPFTLRTQAAQDNARVPVELVDEALESLFDEPTNRSDRDDKQDSLVLEVEDL